MPFLTKKDSRILIQNSRKDTNDLLPVVRLFNKTKAITWLLYKTDPDKPDTIYGFYGKKINTPRLRTVNIAELEYSEVKLQKDKKFNPVHTMSVYIEAGRFLDALIESPDVLDFVANDLKNSNVANKP
jgi:hypothetical protein